MIAFVSVATNSPRRRKLRLLQQEHQPYSQRNAMTKLYDDVPLKRELGVKVVKLVRGERFDRTLVRGFGRACEAVPT